MDISIKKMIPAYGAVIATWVYDDVYAFYNHDADFENECMDGNHFVFINERNELIGYMCFGIEARVPTNEDGAYLDDCLDIGLHIKPDFTGKKLGKTFIKACLDFAIENYNTNRFRATIASFNKRALALCLSNGFSVAQEVTHKITGTKFTIVIRV